MAATTKVLLLVLHFALAASFAKNVMDVCDPDVLRQTPQQLNPRLSQQEIQIQNLTPENQQLTTRFTAQTPTLASGRDTGFPSRSSTQMSVVDARLFGKPEISGGEAQRSTDSFKLKAYFGAIDVRYQAMLAAAEQAI